MTPRYLFNGLIASVAFLAAPCVNAQNLNIYLQDGSKVTYRADRLDYIQFTEEGDTPEVYNILTPEYIPDEMLREEIRKQIADGAETLTNEEAAAYTGSLYISGALESTEGIEFLKSLTELSLYHTKAEEMDLSELKNLHSLTLEFNSKLTSLNIEGLDRLETVDISYNYSLGSFDLTALPSTVTRLKIMQDGFETIDLSTLNYLDRLICSGNNLTSIDLSPVPQLTYVDCSSNNLTTLDVSPCPYLLQVITGSNPLNQINLDGCSYVESIALQRTNIDSFDAQPFKETLKLLNLQDTRVSEINVDGCYKLEALELGNTPVSGPLDLSTCVNLNHLRTENTNITVLDMSNCTHIGELQAYDMYQLEALILPSYLPELFQLNIWNSENLRVFEWGRTEVLRGFNMFGNGGIERVDISQVNHDVGFMSLENENMKEIKVWEGFDIENPPSNISKSENAVFVYEFTED